MSLLTTQRIISNGLAQLDFEEVWPAIRPRSPEESVHQGAVLAQAPGDPPAHPATGPGAGAEGRRVQPVAADAHAGPLGGQRHPVRGGLPRGFFTGAEGQKRRTQNIVEFHDDPTHRILFASDAGGVGLNLQHASNCVINLELPWNPAVLEQRIGRIYRLGQKQPIDVFNLVCEQGIESRIASLVGSKQAFFKGLFDGESDSVQFDQSSSFLTRVEKIYEPVISSEGAPAGGIEGLEDFEPVDGAIDDDVTDSFEEVIEAADESDDRVAALTATEAGPETFEAITENSEPAPDPPPGDSGAEVRRLFSRLTIRKEADGRVVLEAPPEAASALGALFEGMAALLQSASRPAGLNGDESA